MALINSSSAITAKVRSRYGRRLRYKDYQAMAKCESVGDVVRYLKTYTHFQDYLDKVSNDIHRGNLENILHERQFERFLTLCKYNSGNSPVTSYIIRRSEINQLMKFITLLSINRPQEYLFSLPMYFTQHTDLKLTKLSSVHSHGELLEVLEKTDYRKIVEQFSPNSEGDYDLAAVEKALDEYNLKLLYSDINKIKNKKDRSQLKELFDTLADYNNYSRIIRLKKYYNMSNDTIRSYLINYGSFTGSKLNRILRREDLSEVRAALAQTNVGRKATELDKGSEMAVQGRFNRCRHELYFSSNPEIILLAYFIISETELSNVVAVIEGVRYSMPPERIMQILVM